MVEDISRTGFSAFVAAQVLRRINPALDIHTLSLLQRDRVDDAYQKGPHALVYHTFIRRDLPLDVETFKKQFPAIPSILFHKLSSSF